MPLRDHPYLAFLGLSSALFAAATAGSDVIARVTTGGQALSKAIAEHLYYAGTQPAGTALLLLPFLLLGGMSASLAARKGFDRGLAVFLLGTLLLSLMYFSGYQDSQGYMNRRMWTAATLSVGLLPFKSVPVLLLCLGLQWFLARRRRESEA